MRLSVLWKSLLVTPELQNGFDYVGGELHDYSNKRRAMGPLAAFCHAIDVKSARQWFDHPRPRDPWEGAGRVVKG